MLRQAVQTDASGAGRRQHGRLVGFSGVLPLSALACSALLGVSAVTPERLLAAIVVAAGITLGVRAKRGREPVVAVAGAA